MRYRDGFERFTRGHCLVVIGVVLVAALLCMGIDRNVAAAFGHNVARNTLQLTGIQKLIDEAVEKERINAQAAAAIVQAKHEAQLLKATADATQVAEAKARRKAKKVAQLAKARDDLIDQYVAEAMMSLFMPTPWRAFADASPQILESCRCHEAVSRDDAVQVSSVRVEVAGTPAANSSTLVPSVEIAASDPLSICRDVTTSVNPTRF